MFKKFLNLNFDLPKFGTGGGINRHKYIIIFVIFLFSINIKSFGEITLEDPGTPETIGNKSYYKLSTPGHLYWFADQVNNQSQTDINAILTSDITINSEQLINQAKAGGDITGIENWTPIGKDDTKIYKGTFDGNGKTISGLYFNDESQDYVGLFGAVQNGVIRNIGVKNSYFKANNNVGGLIGSFYVEEGIGKVTSSYSSGCTVKGGSGAYVYVGGLIGYFHVNSGGTGEVTSSYSSGCTVKGGPGAYVGGLIGSFYVEEGIGKVTSSYSSGCTVEGGYESYVYVGGLIGSFYVEEGIGKVTSSYSSGCTVEGGYGAYVGGLIGCFDVYSGGTGEVTSSYSSGCTVEGGFSASVGGLIGCFDVVGTGEGEVRSSYSSGCTVKGGANVGGLIGWFDDGGTGEVRSSYSSGCTVTGTGYEAYVGGLIGWFDVGSEGTGEVTSSYSTNTNLTATGENFCKGGICGNLNSGTIKNCFYLKSGDLKGTGNKEDGEEKNDVKPFGAELKIPVRVKINYDPSNKLETLVSKNFKHEFFRKIDDGGWKTMLEEKQYLYDVSPVSGSIKINPDGSKTQDFIFNYYIYQAKDRNGKAYQFGFNKKYPVKTYLREDVGGGKKLYIDYGVWGRE